MSIRTLTEVLMSVDWRVCSLANSKIVDILLMHATCDEILEDLIWESSVHLCSVLGQCTSADQYLVVHKLDPILDAAEFNMAAQLICHY